jgi:4-hydroxyproline epimerase
MYAVSGFEEMFEQTERIRVVDSHTGGEPTRIIVRGGPDLNTGTMAKRLELFRNIYDHVRRATVNEPRGSDIVVGALLCEPTDRANTAGVLFFNNVGYLGMCVHGTIGLIVTLAYLGKIGCGDHRIETPVGTVSATLHETGEVTVVNVPSYRTKSNVAVDVPGHGTVRGDVAWAGNWFFLVGGHNVQIALDNIDQLTEFTWAIRQELKKNGIAGSDGAEIDHIELYGPSQKPDVHSKNFVLCPGKAYDRSPCGTGTSAKLACLYADGKLKPGDVWRQESIVGSIFEGSVRIESGQILPAIKGSAFVTAEADLLLDPRDPFRTGIRT